MKKVMIFLASMLFAVGVNAASLNLSTFDQDVSTNATNLSLTNAPTGAISFNKINAPGNFDLGHHIVSAVDQVVRVDWTFNKAVNMVSGSISKGGDFVLVQSVTGLASYAFNILLSAAQDYYFDLSGVSGGTPLTATLTISAVPVPAALFLFAPVLLGFFGLRRRANTALAA